MAHVSSYARLLSDEPKIGAHGNPVVPPHSHVTTEPKCFCDRNC